MEEIRIPWMNWKVVRVLGQGGFGKVYEIQRSVLGEIERAAMKVVTVPASYDEVEADYSDGYDEQSIRKKYEVYLQDILKEYQLMMDLRGHSNIVCADDVHVEEHEGKIGWTIYIRMELLTPLQSYLRNENRNLTESEVIKLAKDICQALVVCENRNIIHRDIKPENIMLSQFGDFKLGDFGIAKTMDHTTHATKAGTERYMAPEVIKREKYGREVDIYSLGLVLYWLLNRRKMPFLPQDTAPNPQLFNEAQYRRVSGEALPRPMDGSPRLQNVVLKACSYSPSDRYHTAAEMLQALENLDSPVAEKTAQSGPDAATQAAAFKTAPQTPPQTAPQQGGATIGAGWNDASETVGKPIPKAAPRPAYKNVNDTETQAAKNIFRPEPISPVKPSPQAVKPEEKKKAEYKPVGEDIRKYADYPVLIEGEQLSREKLPVSPVPSSGSIMWFIVLIGAIAAFSSGIIPLGIILAVGAVFMLMEDVKKAGGLRVTKATTLAEPDGSDAYIVASDSLPADFTWALAVDKKWVLSGKGNFKVKVKAKVDSHIVLVSYRLLRKNPSDPQLTEMISLEKYHIITKKD